VLYVIISLCYGDDICNKFEYCKILRYPDGTNGRALTAAIEIGPHSKVNCSSKILCIRLQCCGEINSFFLSQKW